MVLPKNPARRKRSIRKLQRVRAAFGKRNPEHALRHDWESPKEALQQRRAPLWKKTFKTDSFGVRVDMDELSVEPFDPGKLSTASLSSRATSVSTTTPFLEPNVGCKNSHPSVRPILTDPRTIL